MEQTNSHKSAIPNPALKPFSVLVGSWKTVGTHPGLPNIILHGNTSFNWMEGGAFLIMHSQIFEAGIPAGIAILGSDNATGEFFMLYFDERKVSRKYQVSFDNNILKWWRNAPGFHQRYTWTITDHNNTIVGEGQLSRDGTNWEKDLELTYSRII